VKKKLITVLLAVKVVNAGKAVDTVAADPESNTNPRIASKS
jgi:hypothetical protein